MSIIPQPLCVVNNYINFLCYMRLLYVQDYFSFFYFKKCVILMSLRRCIVSSNLI